MKFVLKLVTALVFVLFGTTQLFAQQGMGIGNNNPLEMLDVSGAIKLGTTTNTNAGTIRWTGTEFQGWDGTQWITFGGGIATQLTEAQVEAFITNGSLDLFAGTTLNGNAILTTEVDGSITNEIQDLNLTGNILTITNNGSATSIDLSPYVNSLIGLDDAYDNGSTITADAGPVTIAGPDGIDVTGSALIGGSADILGTLNLPNGAAADYIAVSDATGAVTWTDPATITTGDDGDWTVNGTDISNANTGNVGIGTNAPTEILDVNGQIRMRTGATSGYVPASDANGVMIWTDPNTLITPTTTNTLDGAYDQGGAGAGREIDAVDGTVAITGEDGIMVSGTYGSGLAVGATGGIADGVGTRMFFNPNKAAFRAGYVDGTQWDAANIGNYSTAMGGSTTASGDRSTAMGYNTTASGDRSTAMGNGTDASGLVSTAMGDGTTASGPASTAMGGGTNASGDVSTAMGVFTTASGPVSTAMGAYTTASGEYSTAMGSFTIASGSRSTAMGEFATAPSYAETAIGRYNTTYTPASTTAWNTADRLFVVGNGTGTGANSSDAIVVMKNGNTGIGISAPKRLLHVEATTGAQMLFTRDDNVTTDGELMGELLFDNNDDTAPSSVDAAAVIRATASGNQGNSNKGGNILFLTKNNVPSGTAATERMRINANGNVGIGIPTPLARLDVGGTAALNDNQLRLRAGNDANHYLSYIGGAFDGAKLTGNNNVILNTISGGDALIVTGSRVGIGTASPIAPLHVQSTASPSYGNFTYYAFQANAGGGSCCAGTVNDVSIHSAGRVMATEFDAFSDARIKNVVGTSNSFEDLSTLLDIEITDYTMVDKAKDIKPYKKVIAQQVESVYPQAVSTITDVVPDIYAVSSMKDGYVALSTTLQVGDKVKLIFEEGAELVTVTAVDADGFSVDLQKSGDVFVYGREVNDFRTVDYEAISMLNVSATQELFKLVSGLQKANLELKSELKNYASLQSDVEKIKEMLGIDLQTSK